jgi:uncharacterized Fe-S cluster-containing protein
MATQKKYKIEVGTKVMPTHCKTCPFKPDKNGVFQDNELASKVTSRTLFKAHQLCHKDNYAKDKETFRCKGSFDENMKIYKRMNLEHLVK